MVTLTPAARNSLIREPVLVFGGKFGKSFYLFVWGHIRLPFFLPSQEFLTLYIGLVLNFNPHPLNREGPFSFQANLAYHLCYFLEFSLQMSEFICNFLKLVYLLS